MRIKTKKKLSISIDIDAYKKIEGFENKSKYIEWLVYEDLKKSGLLKKEVIL